MKPGTTKFAVIAAVAIAVSMIGSVLVAKAGSFNKTTSDDLSSAMHGEAFAYAKYMLYADHARKNGNEKLAKLFEDAAKTERFEHFAEEAELAGLVGSDQENLKDAFKGESYEVETMYPEFAKKAGTIGDKRVATRFLEIREDEKKHRDGFQAALKELEKNSNHGM